MAQVEDEVTDEARNAPAAEASQIEQQGDRLGSAAKFACKPALDTSVIAPPQNALGTNANERTIRSVQ